MLIVDECNLFLIVIYKNKKCEINTNKKMSGLVCDLVRTSRG